MSAFLAYIRYRMVVQSAERKDKYVRITCTTIVVTYLALYLCAAPIMDWYAQFKSTQFCISGRSAVDSQPVPGWLQASYFLPAYVFLGIGAVLYWKLYKYVVVTESKTATALSLQTRRKRNQKVIR